jgi:hypothetical protein
MIKQEFEDDETYLPVTMQQFENLTNEILTAVNAVCDPHFLNADYMAQILMSAIHSYDHKLGILKKSELFENCINRISCHITFHAVEQIQNKMKLEEAKQKAENGEPHLESVPNPEPETAH